MVRKLARLTLKTGERMQCLLVQEPEDSWAADVQRLLVHKRDHVLWHIARSIAGPLDALETRFYLGVVNGEAVGNIMTVEYDGIGILGHVFTQPKHRRKGIASHIMGAQMRDFREREGRVLTLGTGFDSPPYWIYHSYGFRSVAAGSGAMWFWRQQEQAAELWRAAITGVTPPLWHHWPLVNLLCIQPDGDRLRLAARGLWGPRNFEGGFTQYKRDLESEDSTIVSRVLENRGGAGGGIRQSRGRSVVGRRGGAARSLGASHGLARGGRLAQRLASAVATNLRLRRSGLAEERHSSHARFYPASVLAGLAPGRR